MSGLMSGRRELTLAVLLCAAGAAIALVAMRQSWMVEVSARPAPLPPSRTSQTGGDLRPWVPALAWVALAGAGALLATRAALRRVVGALLALAGAGVGAGAATAGWGGQVSAGWPVLAAVGGVMVGIAGVATALRSRRWPALGARYERTARRRRPPRGAPEELWEALDRGEDPTT